MKFVSVKIFKKMRTNFFIKKGLFNEKFDSFALEAGGGDSASLERATRTQTKLYIT